MTRYTLLLWGALLLWAGCAIEEKITDGSTAFDRKQYAKAIPFLEGEYAKSRSSVAKGKLAWQLGECYRLTQQPEAATKWYQEAYNFAYGVEALQQYAYMLKQTERYPEAIEAFKDLGAETGDPFAYQRELVACRQAAAWGKQINKQGFSVELLDFNTAAADYYPALFENGNLIITSDRNASTGETRYGWTGNDFSDLFLVNITSGTVENFSPQLNSPYNDGTIAFNADFTEAYFSRCGSGSKERVEYCKLYVSERVGDSWTTPQMLEFCEPSVNYGHPSLAADGKTLFFAADHPEGLGKFDLYSTRRKADGWDTPANLGTTLNTEGNEIAPHIHRDTLYFASDFHVGMGGLDVFKAIKTNGKWGAPQNLKAPVNSGADDFGLVVAPAARRAPDVLAEGYFTSNRKGGRGNDDIYRFVHRIVPPDTTPAPLDSTTLVVTNGGTPTSVVRYSITLKINVLEKKFSIPDNPNSGVTGKQALAGVRLQVVSADTNFVATLGADGTLRLRLKEQTAYQFFATKSDYLAANAVFSTVGIERDPANPNQSFSLDMVLDKIYRNVEITLENIYYDFNESFIRNDARPALNQLADILRQNPNIRIQLASHTDCRGNDAYNLRLSQDRAQAAVDYLVTRGVARDRLLAKGFGETQPAATCACSQCSEDQHQQNRRTTFAILSD